jgi:hypothetical protein
MGSEARLAKHILPLMQPSLDNYGELICFEFTFSLAILLLVLGQTETGPFNNAEFWKWAEHMAQNNAVFVSEYSAPPQWECIWDKEVGSSLDRTNKNKTGIERLFILRGFTELIL